MGFKLHSFVVNIAAFRVVCNDKASKEKLIGIKRFSEKMNRRAGKLDYYM